MIRDAVRRAAHSELLPTAAARDLSETFPDSEMRRLGQLGFMGVAIPEQWGGAGADYVSLALAIEEIAAVDGASAVIVSTHNSLGCLPLLQYGTEAQKKRFLTPLARGDKIGAFSITETQSGSNAADVRMRAIRKNGEYVLNGAKQFVTNGAAAGIILVFAATEPSAGHKGISCFIVTDDSPGYRIGRVEKKMGIRSSVTAEIVFDEVVVGEDRMLGSPGDGYGIALDSLGKSRIGIAAQAVGLARGALSAALGYAKERESFGKAIIEHQAIAFTLADMATKIEAARQLTLYAASLHDAGLPYQKELSMAKLFAGRMAERVCSDAIQIHGGYGYLRDFPVERFYRDARICQIYEGTNEIQRMIISRALAKEQ